MAVTNLLPAGSDAATSSNFVLAGGQTMTLAGAARGTTYWRATIERRMSDGAWEPVGYLTWDARMTTLYGDGESRVSRQAGSG